MWIGASNVRIEESWHCNGKQGCASSYDVCIYIYIYIHGFDREFGAETQYLWDRGNVQQWFETVKENITLSNNRN